MARVSKRDCSGCRNDFYNKNDMVGNMKKGVPQCWSLVSAVFVKRLRIPDRKSVV